MDPEYEATRRAFPAPGGSHPDDLGLTRREYFAARALEGLLAKYGVERHKDEVVACAVEADDALIEKLDRTKQ